MAKARKKKAHKTAKRASKKRKTVVKSKRRVKAGRAKRAKRVKQGSFVDALREAAALRSRLAGHNTFED